MVRNYDQWIWHAIEPIPDPEQLKVDRFLIVDGGGAVPLQSLDLRLSQDCHVSSGARVNIRPGRQANFIRAGFQIGPDFALHQLKAQVCCCALVA